MYRLYDYLPSGNGYKVRLLLTQLGVPFDLVELDITKGLTRTPDFLAKNPNGRIPTLEVEPGIFLAESNAIMFYLAENSAFFPTERLERARVLQWMCFEQYSHEPNIATVRFWLSHGELTPERRAQLDQKRQLGYAALGVMEQHLAPRAFFVGERYSIADIALYAYTHVADEGGFDLSPYPAIRDWLDRVRSQPRHIPITQEIGFEGSRVQGSQTGPIIKNPRTLEPSNPRTLPTCSLAGGSACRTARPCAPPGHAR